MILVDENIEIIVPTDDENGVLNDLNKDFEKFSQMTNHEREYINALILRNKPNKLLEIGVSAGSSTLIILNAIKDMNKSKLYSIDYSISWYKSDDKKTGFLVDDYIGLKNKWELYTGGLSIDFLDKIGEDIDFCFIDTMHINPGGILDFLMVLPYLKEDAIVVLHDTKLNTCDYPRREWHIPNNLLMSSITGKKIIQGNFFKEDDNNGIRTVFPNIGGIKLNKHSKMNIFEIVNLLTLRWDYFPKDEELNRIKIFCKSHYNRYIIEYLEKIFEYQKECSNI